MLINASRTSTLVKGLEHKPFPILFPSTLFPFPRPLHLADSTSSDPNHLQTCCSLEERPKAGKSRTSRSHRLTTGPTKRHQKPLRLGCCWHPVLQAWESPCGSAAGLPRAGGALLCSSALLLLLPLPSTSPKWCCPSFEGCEQEAAELPNVDSGWVSPGMGPLNQPVLAARRKPGSA